MSVIESINKLKVVNSSDTPKYDVFNSVNYSRPPDDIYLGLVKLDLEART